MKIFPHTLVRTGGSTFDDLETLNINSVLESEFYELMNKYEDLKQHVIDELYLHIGELDNTDHQNLLLNLKRDIFNDRLDTNQELSHLFPLVSNCIQILILEIISLKQTIDECELKFETVYLEQVGKVRNQFKKMIQDPTLQKGLLLSSKSLLKRIPFYLEKNPKQFSRNDIKAEHSLLKYLTRIKTKTSPFSTFTNLAITSHSKKKNEFLEFKSRNSSIVSHVRLNNAMYVYLRSLLFQHSDIYPWFPISLNPTIRNNGKEFLFLTNHNNIESFQRISINPMLEFIKEMLEQEEQSLRLIMVVDKLRQHVEASEVDIIEYIKKLVDFGFLEFDLGISGLDPDWDLKLREFLYPLEEHDVPYIKQLCFTLETIRAKAKEFENAGLERRKTLLNEAFNTFKEFCMNLHEAAGLPEDERINEQDLRKIRRNVTKKGRQEDGGDSNKKKENKMEPFIRNNSTRFRFKSENIFYEDTSLTTDMKTDYLRLEAVISSMDKLLRYLQPFENGRFERKKMKDYFIHQYGKGEFVPLFSFYEDFFRDVKKPETDTKRNDISELKKEKPKPAENGDSEVIRWQNNILKHFEHTDPPLNETIHIENKHLQIASKRSNLNIDPLKKSSFGMFIQIYFEKDSTGKDQLKGVINGVFPGFGRMMSRFLHLFDPEITNELRTWNHNLSNGNLLIENCDASCFNANIHPSLMPGEIRMPGSQNTLREEQQIPITDLFVEEKDGILFLKNKSNKKTVYTFDLGFQGFKGHSQLFQLLSRFTLAKFLYPSPLIETVNKHIEKNKKPKDVLMYPRVVFENSIVLQRKRWTVPIVNLPVQNQQESDASYFLRVNVWRKRYHIPNEVFVKVFSRFSNQMTKHKKQLKIGKDDYKPQYINFNSPLLVNLFSKLVKKVPYKLQIEEMLPDSDQLHKFGKNRYVTEYMVQWYYF